MRINKNSEILNKIFNRFNKYILIITNKLVSTTNYSMRGNK